MKLIQIVYEFFKFSILGEEKKNIFDMFYDEASSDQHL